MPEFYQQGYFTLLVAGFALGAIAAHYWPAVFGWRADERQYRKDLVVDMGMLRAQLAAMADGFDGNGATPAYNDMKFISNNIEAIELALDKRGISIPGLEFDTDPIGYIYRYRDYFQTVGPILAVGHLKEAKAAAKRYVAGLNPEFMRADRRKALEKKGRRELPAG